MNLGIVIAVSKYKCSSDDLPGCTVDGQLINALLKGTEKFDDYCISKIKKLIVI